VKGEPGIQKHGQGGTKDTYTWTWDSRITRTCTDTRAVMCGTEPGEKRTELNLGWSDLDRGNLG
jgi:hypothetical protein